MRASSVKILIVYLKLIEGVLALARVRTYGHFLLVMHTPDYVTGFIFWCWEENILQTSERWKTDGKKWVVLLQPEPILGLLCYRLKYVIHYLQGRALVIITIWGQFGNMHTKKKPINNDLKKTFKQMIKKNQYYIWWSFLTIYMVTQCCTGMRCAWWIHLYSRSLSQIMYCKAKLKNRFVSKLPHALDLVCVLVSLQIRNIIIYFLNFTFVNNNFIQ